MAWFASDSCWLQWKKSARSYICSALAWLSGNSLKSRIFSSILRWEIIEVLYFFYGGLAVVEDEFDGCCRLLDIRDYLNYLVSIVLGYLV